MTKDVLISTKGLKFRDAVNTDQLETLTSGIYYDKSNYHYVLFEEKISGFQKITKCTLKFNQNEFILMKRGLVQTRMEFRENYSDRTSYITPYGTVVLEICTKHYKLQKEDARITLYVNYELMADNEKVADSTIEICIYEKI